MDRLEKIREILNNKKDVPPPRPPEKMTAEKVDFNYRIYWTKMSLKWDIARRAAVREKVLAITQQVDFEDNLIEKRYHLELEDVPEQLHSGTSLLALVVVLDTLDNME